MNHKARTGALTCGLISAALCTGAVLGGSCWPARSVPEPPVPDESRSVLAVPAEEPAIGTADLWSDDRNRTDTPLVSVELAAETQWAIFEQCGQDAELFCAVMAIAAVESGFDPQMVGDDGDSIGMMQINTKWHTGRIEALGVTELTDPVQCAAVAIDYLLELEEIMGVGPGDHALYMGYNSGPDSATRKIQSGITANTYSTAAVDNYRNYITEMVE